MSTRPTETAPLEIGRVVRAHGLRGAVNIALHFKGSDALDDAQQVTLKDAAGAERAYAVRHVGGTGGFRTLELEGVDDRNQAEALRGARVLISRLELPPLEPGAYYLADLVGATVSAPDGVVGQVVEIALHPSVDALVIETPEGERLEQPLLDHWLQRVDVAAKAVVLTSRDGLM